MKTEPIPHRTGFARGLLMGAHLVLLGLSLLVCGCASTAEVTKIITQSNAALLASQLGELEQKGGGTPRETWQETNERLEAFVAAYPAEPDATAPLRIRQAMLLLANGQLNLAQAAFNSAAPAHLHTERDQALAKLKNHLIWWFGVSLEDTWSDRDQTSAENALVALKAEYETMDQSPAIRDYLAEMRAWMGIAAARQASTPEIRRARFERALNDYAATFTDENKTLLASGGANLTTISGLTSDVRRCMRAEILLRQARAFNIDDAIGAQLIDPTFQKLIEAPPRS